MTAGALITVTLVGLPLALYREASEHQDELQREFSLIQREASLGEESVPTRLLRLIEELNGRFAGYSTGPRAAMVAALERGETTMDVEYRLPPQAREAAIALGELLDEADDFCRQGAHLLTLATPPGALALRRWFLTEMVAQLDGADPVPWDEWDPQARGGEGGNGRSTP